jgi:hypothetical protein
MAEAMQIFVHGFYQVERIEAITQYLLSIGFIVNDSFPIDCNEMGGLIETDITDIELVSEADPSKILLELRRRTECDGIWIDVRKFRLIETNFLKST